MERRFQYYEPFRGHTQYRARARARELRQEGDRTWFETGRDSASALEFSAPFHREHNNTMEKFILNFTHLFHVHEHWFNMYVRIFILRICARRRRSLNEAFLVKIANIISCPRRGFRWYPYFVAQEQLVAFEASK